MTFKMSRDILIHYTEDIQSLSLRKGCCNKWSENAGIAKISFAPHPPILAHLWIWNATCFMLFFGHYFFTCFVIFCQSHKQPWHSQNPPSWQWQYFHFICYGNPSLINLKYFEARSFPKQDLVDFATKRTFERLLACFAQFFSNNQQIRAGHFN